jgi:myo-inositol-1-phosphate synthase
MRREIRTAIIGVGNCASALVQGIEFYRGVQSEEGVAGLMHTVVGGYLPADIRFTAAFDVDARKVGKDLSEAIFTLPNNTRRFATVPTLGVAIQAGPLFDGIGRYCREVIPVFRRGSCSD